MQLCNLAPRRAAPAPDLALGTKKTLTRMRRAERCLVVKVSADYVRVSITRGIGHEEAGEELLEFMRCVLPPQRSAHNMALFRIPPLFWVKSLKRGLPPVKCGPSRALSSGAWHNAEMHTGWQLVRRSVFCDGA
jgi:hypothetical protein